MACTFEEILEDSSVEMLVILTPALQTGRKEKQGRQGNGISCVGYYLSDDEKQRNRGF